MINKYYVVDLAPGRSLVEYLVGEGQQVFVISWRNPDARHPDWGLDTYGRAVLDAMDAVERISGVERTHLLGSAPAASSRRMLAGPPGRDGSSTGSPRSTSASRCSTRRGPGDRRARRRQPRRGGDRLVRAQGYLDGRSLAEVFAWLRPGDLIWNYWVNNYLQGSKPPAFDILFWNADTTRMTAALHRDFVDLAAGQRA